jgi:tetratricopeptide (TPR) repeat protein
MNVTKLIEKGEDALKKRNFDYAISIFLEAVSFAPNERRAREGLRKAELKKYEHAYPSPVMAAIFGLGARFGMLFSSLSKKTSPEGFMMACERYLTKDPKNYRVNMALGDAAALGGHRDAAIFAYETAAEHNPDDVAALKKLAHLLWKTGHIKKAHEVYDRVVALAPKDQEAIKARKNVAAEASLKETGFETAASSRDLVKDKEAAGRIEQEGRLFQTEEDLDTQLAALEKQVEERAGDVDVLRKLADVHVKRGDYDKALEAMDRAIEAKPNEPALQFARGDIVLNHLELEVYELRQQGRTEEADAKVHELLRTRVEEFQHRVRVYPTDLKLRFELGEMLLELEETDQAIAQFQQTVRDPKYKSESQLRLGRAFAFKGQFDLAIRQLEQALEGQSGMSERVKEIHYLLGDIHARKGDLERARGEFGTIYEVDIGYRDVADRLSKLESGA